MPAMIKTLVALCLLVVLAPTPAQGRIRQANVVFSNHLDVGFDGIGPEVGLDNNVINKYFREYFPKAVAVGAALRAMPNGTERLVYTTHSWLVNIFLDCPASIGVACPSLAEIDTFKAAVAAGDITWHAMPHNGQTELYDEDLLQFAVRSTHDLDQAFGQREKVTMSQRDVPGLTRNAIPILASEGVRVLSVGVNGGSAPPAVPFNTPFWWRDEPSSTQLLAFWHPGGYSGTPVDGKDECVQVAGFDRALCCAWRTDNAGPPDVDEVLGVFARVRAAFPHATVTASGFDDFSRPLLEAAPALQLPVVTAEIGDTWIHGVGSDPGKLAEYRALLRMRRVARERYDDPAFKRFSMLLLKVPEHTWGVDIKDALSDYENWANGPFHAQLASGNPHYAVTVLSWVRQRAWLGWAVSELGNSEAGVAAWQALAALQQAQQAPVGSQHQGPSRDAESNGRGGGRLEPANLSQPLVFESHAWWLQLSNTTGAIVGLQRRPEAPGSSDASPTATTTTTTATTTTTSWASPTHPLCDVVYSSYSEADFDVFWNDYAYAGFGSGVPDWYRKDFGKPGSTSRGGATRADFLPAVHEVLWRQTAEEGLRVVVRARFPAAAVQEAGAPQGLWIEVRSPAGSDDLLVDVGWEAKTATRLPETLWVRWRPPWGTPPPGGAGGHPAMRSKGTGGGASSTSSEGSGGGKSSMRRRGRSISSSSGSSTTASPAEDSGMQGALEFQTVVYPAQQEGDGTSSPTAPALAAVVGQETAAGMGAALTAAALAAREEARVGVGVDPASWLLWKLGRPISPLEVILNGSRSLHAIDDSGVAVAAAAAPPGCAGGGARGPGSGGGSRAKTAAAAAAAAAAPAPRPWLRIRSLDAALVSPGRPTPFPNLSQQPEMEEGVSFALTNNIWGTNYPMWVPYVAGDKDMTFRFILQEEEGSAAAEQALAAAAAAAVQGGQAPAGAEDQAPAAAVGATAQQVEGQAASSSQQQLEQQQQQQPETEGVGGAGGTGTQEPAAAVA